MVAGALILAAGGSPPGSDAHRAVNGGTALAVVLRTLRTAAIEPVVVVASGSGEDLRDVVEPAGAHIVSSPDPAGPMIGSIRSGLDALPDDTDGALVWPVDHPLVAIGTVRALLDAHANGAAIAVPVCDVPGNDHGRRGHPVLFSRGVFDAVRAVSDDEGAASVIHSRPDEVVEIPVLDRGIIADIGSPETKRLIERLRRAAAASKGNGEIRRRPSRKRKRRPSP